MVDKSRATANTLNEKLAKIPFKWDFFQAVRHLECTQLTEPRIGESEHAKDDPIRFCQKPTLAFSPSSISMYEISENSIIPPRMYINFMGLLGPNGPMPRYITEYVFHRILHHKDYTLSRFLDIFNHRMISFFYRAWASHQPTVYLDRKDDHRLSVFVGSFFGLGIKQVRKLDALPDFGKLYFTGRLVSLSKHPEGIQAILSDYFKVPVTIIQMVGQWIDIPKSYLCHLGKSLETGQLGKNVLLGQRIWDCQQKFKIKIGPLNFSDFQRMLPGNGSLDRLIAWVRNYVGKEFEWDLQLIVDSNELPDTKLNGITRLGLTSWVYSKTETKKNPGNVNLGPFDN